MIVVVSCGSTKADKPCMAQHMYRGNMFKAQMRYARSLVPDKNIYIISAKYGLLRMTDVIAPYNASLKDGAHLPLATVQRQAQRLGITNASVVFVGGKAYRDLLRKVFPDFYAPFAKQPEGILPEGKCRLGYQKHAMLVYEGQVPRMEKA